MHESLSLKSRQAASVARTPFNDDIKEILSLIGDGVVSIDHRGRIILFNRAAEELFGYTSKEVLLQPLEMLIPMRFQDRHQEAVDVFVAATATSARHSMGGGREVMGRHKNGREFPVEATLSRHMFAEQQIFTAVVRDVTDQKTAEQQRQLIAGEVAHRLHNTMAVVSSIVSMTARGAASLPEFIDSLMGRLAAISRTNDVLIGGKGSDNSLHKLLLSELAPFQDENKRIVLTGSEVKIEGELALNLAMIFHELTTNAAKYGALSAASGVVHIDWHISPDEKPVLKLMWRETGGPKVMTPERSGFGSKLISRMLHQHGGQTQMTYHASGVCCTIVLPHTV